MPAAEKQEATPAEQTDVEAAEPAAKGQADAEGPSQEECAAGEVDRKRRALDEPTALLESWPVLGELEAGIRVAKASSAEEAGVEVAEQTLGSHEGMPTKECISKPV